HRSSVPTPMPIPAETVSTGELCGGNKRATTLSLNCCPYRAMSVFQRPLRFGSYPGDNFFDTGGFVAPSPQVYISDDLPAAYFRLPVMALWRLEPGFPPHSSSE